MTLREYIKEYGNNEIAEVKTMGADTLTIEEALEMTVIMTIKDDEKVEIIVA